MTRSMTTDVENAFQASHLDLIVFIELAFASGVIRVTNATRNVEWDGKTWLGAGNVGKIGQVQEGAELQMYGIAMQLSGIPSEYISIALNEHYQGKDCKIWVAPLNADTSIIDDPIQIFFGRMDTMSIDEGSEGTSTIILTAESRLSDWERPRIRRYNNEDQISVHPDDKGFEFVPQMVEKQLPWGR